MNIAILGPGAIGSTFALHLSKAGHEVTVVARNKRLEQLRRDEAIVTPNDRAKVQVAAELNPSIAYDLLLVTVLAPQVDAVLPAITKSAATKVMFMFNTFEPLTRLREAVGADRFSFGFPAILATFDDTGVLTSKVVTRGQITTVTDPTHADLFTKAGIPSVVHADMESWLRTHAAMVVPFMVAVGQAHQRQAGLTWSESWKLARAMDEGLTLVKKLGNTITPAPMKVLDCLPKVSVAALLWSATRSTALRKTGAAGMKEPRALIDSMKSIAPGQVPTLSSLPLD